MTTERYIYIVKCPETGLVRIAKTNYVRQKIADQRIEYGVDLIPLAYAENLQGVNLKHEIQKSLADFRVEYPQVKKYPRDRQPTGFTDWFDIPDEQWDTILDTLFSMGIPAFHFTEKDEVDIDERTRIALLDHQLSVIVAEVQRLFYEQNGNYNLNRPTRHE